MIRLIINISTTQYISINLVENNIKPIGVAECSLIDNNLYYFNRLYVSPSYRGKKFGTKLLDTLLKIFKEYNLILKLDINPYGGLNYEQLESFYIRHGFEKCLIRDTNGSYCSYFYNKGGTNNMDVTVNDFNLKPNQIATVLTEQTFYIGKNANIEVMVNLYENNGQYYITSWLNGCEECDTELYEGSIDNQEEILAAMEKLVNDNEEYIIDLADWDGN